jgi:hypothetical protein
VFTLSRGGESGGAVVVVVVVVDMHSTTMFTLRDHNVTGVFQWYCIIYYLQVPTWAGHAFKGSISSLVISEKKKKKKKIYLNPKHGRSDLGCHKFVSCAPKVQGFRTQRVL